MVDHGCTGSQHTTEGRVFPGLFVLCLGARLGFLCLRNTGSALVGNPFTFSKNGNFLTIAGQTVNVDLV